MTCPSAGICAQYCYARNGTYLFPKVRAAHLANLERILADPIRWRGEMIAELRHQRFRPNGVARQILGVEPDPERDPFVARWLEAGGAAVRIHDSGDFFSAEYLARWIEIASVISDVLFYAYTKEVSLLRAAGPLPQNLRIVISTGGLEDHLIRPDEDRHADVFPSEQAIADAGYTSQDASDLLAVLAPSLRIGIPANNIKHYNRRLAGRRFSEAVPVRLRMPSEPAPNTP